MTLFLWGYGYAGCSQVWQLFHVGASIVTRHSRTKRTNRREFFKDTSKIAVAGFVGSALYEPGLSLARSAHVAGRDTIRIGLVGCGGRGTAAAIEAMNAEGANNQLTAVADAFQHRMDDALVQCQRSQHGDRVQCGDAKFVGFDGYKDLMQSDVDLVILATPPGFRPVHFEAAIEAGKHVFMEKPVAVDVPGVRRVLAATAKAREKNLAVGVGLQRRHERAYRETIGQLQNGLIGDLIFSRVYWNGDTPWVRTRTPGQTELEYQMTNWYFFNWLCGDHIVEQHIHNLDVINWLLDDYPVSAHGMGGRAVRTGKDHGQIFDHHSVEYTFANGHKMISQCRQMPECWNEVSEYVHGTRGYADINAGRIFDASGKELFYSKGERGGHQQEHHDLFADLRNGIIPNEGEYGAKSTMTSILGRLATYTGKLLKWEDAIQSNVRLANVDELHSMSDPAPVLPDKNGKYPIPVPGAGSHDVIDWDPRGR